MSNYSKVDKKKNITIKHGTAVSNKQYKNLDSSDNINDMKELEDKLGLALEVIRDLKKSNDYYRDKYFNKVYGGELARQTHERNKENFKKLGV